MMWVASWVLVTTLAGAPAWPYGGQEGAKRVSEIVAQGFKLLEQNDAYGAETAFRKAIELQPRSATAHRGLGEALWVQARARDAVRELRAAVQLDPSDAAAYAALGEALFHAGQVAEARGALEKAVALDAGDWHSQFRLAQLLLEAGEASRAMPMLEKVIRAQPEFLPAQEELAVAQMRRGDLESARAQAESMTARNSKAPEGHRLLALLLWKQRSYEDSLAECALALSGDPDSASMLGLQALELWELGDKKAAQQAFRQAVKVEPRIGTSEVFCRLVTCEARDVGLVENFLRRNRVVILPAP